MTPEKDIVLSVRGVSKCFEIYEKPVHRLYQTLCAGKKKFYKEFWALRDVSFDVRRGECVGIIGRNGAGKSTLLQIITGTLMQTSGEVEKNGRIAALLELGSGFNPEFTGRENVYLNGSILGFTREEMDQRFNEIADFADIGGFIDQPVKTYSSGMMVRLAFAVQVMVDPEILIVDEALAVGDIGFQMRCFQKLHNLRAKGTTLLFVTHDLNAVTSFCNKVLFLKDGQPVMYTTNVVGAVSAFKESLRVTHQSRNLAAEAAKDVSEYRFGSHDATIDKLEIFESLENQADLGTIVAGRRYCIGVTITARMDIPYCVMGLAFRNREGLDVWGDNTLAEHPMGFSLRKGENRMVFETDFNVNAGEYGVTAGLADISVNPRIELDQRWPMRPIAVVATRSQPSLAYAPMVQIL